MAENMSSQKTEGKLKKLPRLVFVATDRMTVGQFLAQVRSLCGRRGAR